MDPEDLQRLQEFADRCKEEADGNYTLRLTREERQEMQLLLLKCERELGLD